MYGSSIFSCFFFLRNLHTLLHNSWSNLHPHPQCGRIPFCPHPLQHLLFVDCFFLLMSILKCVVILHFSLMCIPLKISDAEPHMLLGHLYVFFGEMPVQIFQLLFDQVVCFLILGCMSCLYFLEINSLLVALFVNIFSQSRGLTFCLWLPLLCKSH